jgi:hypothetical protein
MGRAARDWHRIRASRASYLYLPVTQVVLTSNQKGCIGIGAPSWVDAMRINLV